MKIVVAPNAFKDSLGADDAARAIARGITSVLPDAVVVRVPVADGGDGLFDVCERVFGGVALGETVTGPLFKPITTEFLFLPESRTAVVEMARTSGLALLKPEERNARSTTSLGLGELALAAIAAGATRILVGIGGSATNDGGMGFASALGYRFLDARGNAVRPIGEDLPNVASIDASALKFDPAAITFVAVCDVDNPLTGPRGAAAVFGPQKGATPDDVRYLDAGLANLARRIRECLGRDVASLPGAGAAGGMGAGLAAFAGAELRPGVDVVLDMVGIDRELADADLAITAEGRIDFQTAFGKGPAGVAARAKKHGVPCLGLAGGLAGDYANLHEMGMDACFSICAGPMTLEEAVRDAAPLLEAASAQAFRAFLAGSRRGNEGIPTRRKTGT